MKLELNRKESEAVVMEGLANLYPELEGKEVHVVLRVTDGQISITVEVFED